MNCFWWFRLFNQKRDFYDNVIEVVKSKNKEYRIFGDVEHGYNAVVRPASKFKYAVELLSDYIGITYTHPVWFANFRPASLEWLKKDIAISIEMDEGRYIEKVTHFVVNYGTPDVAMLCGSGESYGTNFRPAVTCEKCKEAIKGVHSPVKTSPE